MLRSRRAYPAPPERAGVGSIPANSDARIAPSFRRWRFEMELGPPVIYYYILLYIIIYYYRRVRERWENPVSGRGERDRMEGERWDGWREGDGMEGGRWREGGRENGGREM